MQDWRVDDQRSGLPLFWCQWNGGKQFPNLFIKWPAMVELGWHGKDTLDLSAGDFANAGKVSVRERMAKVK